MVEKVASHYQLFVALFNIQATLNHPKITPEIAEKYRSDLLNIEQKVFAIIQAFGSIANIDAAIQQLEPGHPHIEALKINYDWINNYQK